MAETKEMSREEGLKMYQAYVERIVSDLNACKKVGCYYIKEAGPGIYRIFNNGVHMDLIVGEERALLFDTGHGFGDLHEAVRAVTDLPLYVVNSHGHLDHACGNCWFEEEVYIHPKDMELCRQHNSPQGRKDGIGMAEESAGRFPGIETLPADFDAERYLQMGCGNLVPVEEGHVFDLGGRTLRVIELPGHTKGSIGLLYPEEKLLYVGDAINSGLWLFLEESEPLSVYRETLEKAWGIDFEKIVMAHDFEMRPKAVLQDYMDVAENLDFEKGFPFASPVCKGEDVRQCMRPGQTMADVVSPGFASIMISRRQLG